MMKKIIPIIVLVFGIFIFGIISVDERQNVIVTNVINPKQQLLGPGLHFIWPGIDKANYVFINQRNAVLSLILDFNNDSQVEVSTAIEWHVTNPVIYFNSVQKLSSDGFDQALVNKVKQVLISRAQTTNLSTFNQLNNLLATPLTVDDLGIIITNISPSELRMAESMVQMIKPNESAVVVNNSQITIESAYYQAQKIKIQTEILQARMLQQLEAKDPRFYAYFRKLQIYRNSAKSKQDMPTLENLYK